MEKMSRPLPLNPTFIPPPYGVLRSLLENPLKLPLHHEDGERCLPGCPALGRNDAPWGPLPWLGNPAGASIPSLPVPWHPIPALMKFEEPTHHPPSSPKRGIPSLRNV